MRVQCPSCNTTSGEIRYNQVVSRTVTMHLDASTVDGIGDVTAEIFESETPTEVKCSKCGHEGTAEEFGLTRETDVDALQLAKDKDPIEADTIKRAIAKGWKLPPLTELWGWMNECMSEGDRAREVIGDLFEEAYPTDEAKLIAGYSWQRIPISTTSNRRK